MATEYMLSNDPEKNRAGKWGNGYDCQNRERQKKNYVLSPVTSSKFLGSVGRQTFLWKKV